MADLYKSCEAIWSSLSRAGLIEADQRVVEVRTSSTESFLTVAPTSAPSLERRLCGASEVGASGDSTSDASNPGADTPETAVTAEPPSGSVLDIAAGGWDEAWLVGVSS